jgi:hypothetical protein
MGIIGSLRASGAVWVLGGAVYERGGALKAE